MPVHGKEEHDREMAARARATMPADLALFALPVEWSEDDLMGFARGVTAFRSGDFYLAHDLWEDVWHGYRRRDRLFLQGLIHVAVGGYHAQCRNARGAVSQFTKAIDKMNPYAPCHWGLDVVRLIERVELIRGDVVDGKDPKSALRLLRKGV